MPALRLALAGTLLVFALYFPAQIAQVLNPGFGIWFTETFVFFGLAFVLVRMTGRSPVAFPGLGWPGLPQAAFGFAFGAANFFAVAVPLQLLAISAFPQSWVEAFDSGRILQHQAPWDLAAIVTGVTLAAPFGEEYFFRGVLQRSLAASGRIRPVWALVVAAVVFSAFHLDPVGFIPRVELGIAFGWLYYRTRSLWPAVAAHAANNAVTVTLFFLSGDDEASEPAAVSAGDVREIVLYVAVALTVLGGLLLAAAKRPRLLAPRVEDDEGPVLPSRSFYALVWPWALGAVLSVAALWAVDRRGVALNLSDLRNPLPEAAREAEGYADLRALREKARRGEAPRADYEAMRKRLGEVFAPPQRKR